MRIFYARQYIFYVGTETRIVMSPQRTWQPQQQIDHFVFPPGGHRRALAEVMLAGHENGVE